jgi:hypothetical protein
MKCDQYFFMHQFFLPHFILSSNSNPSQPNFPEDPPTEETDEKETKERLRKRENGEVQERRSDIAFRSNGEQVAAGFVSPINHARITRIVHDVGKLQHHVKNVSHLSSIL